MSHEWTPAVGLDVMAATQQQFEEKAREFYRIMRDVSLPKGLLTTGWHTVTPEIAEKLLLGKANRPLSVKTIAYYARQMKNDDWLATGEPIIISDDDIMRDAYHRCWACYLAEVPFYTFVVTGVPSHEYLFAYIDNGQSRSAADAIATAGLNGLSKRVVATILIAVKYDSGVFNPHSRVRIPKMSPMENVRYIKEHSTLHDAVNEVASEYGQALTDLYNKKKPVLYFVGWRVGDLYGSEVFEEFMADLADHKVTTGPVAILRTKLQADVDCRSTLSTKEVLAFTIKAFNAWRGKQPMRRLILATDEPFPTFDTPPDDEDAQVAA